MNPKIHEKLERGKDKKNYF